MIAAADMCVVNCGVEERVQRSTSSGGGGAPPATTRNGGSRAISSAMWRERSPSLWRW
jgi:hypothetical protein